VSYTYTVIFGLTGDPIHKGHEQAIINGVHYLRECGFEIENFILIPVFQPNLIAGKKLPLASFDERIEMCKMVTKRLSAQLDCKMVVSEIEKQMAQNKCERSYSLNTIKQLDLPNSLFMVSADHFQGRWPKFRKWFGWQEILKYSGLLINQRPGHKINNAFIDQLKNINPEIYIVEKGTSVDTSSTNIRTNFYSSDMVPYLSCDIIEYIKRNDLYLNK